MCGVPGAGRSESSNTRVSRDRIVRGTHLAGGLLLSRRRAARQRASTQGRPRRQHGRVRRHHFSLHEGQGTAWTGPERFGSTPRLRTHAVGNRGEAKSTPGAIVRVRRLLRAEECGWEKVIIILRLQTRFRKLCLRAHTMWVKTAGFTGNGAWDGQHTPSTFELSVDSFESQDASSKTAAIPLPRHPSVVLLHSSSHPDDDEA